jgi:glucosamine kinase
MILIADSGSTKTDWRLVDGKKNIHQFQTTGLNPFFLSENQVAENIRRELMLKENFSSVHQLFFYGAGCGAGVQREMIMNALKKVFPNAKIEVNHDLLAACRSLCGRDKGIVAILGTGSNSCYYENEIIAEQVPSLGYLLGDEGSGNYMGKKLLQAFFYHELPETVMLRFQQRFNLTKDDVLASVYSKPQPNRFLASFMHFIFQNKNEKELAEIVRQSFDDFFIHHICKYKNHKKEFLHCTGSVAFYFNDMLRSVAHKYDVQVGKITESPIAGLTLYHLNEH